MLQLSTGPVQFTVTPSFVQNGVSTTKEKLGLVPDVKSHKA
jgi:hypothetical protein